jgi:hypothetical protein
LKRLLQIVEAAYLKAVQSKGDPLGKKKVSVEKDVFYWKICGLIGRLKKARHDDDLVCAVVEILKRK